jgi:thiamine-phosphate pyrophosphorylase
VLKLVFITDAATFGSRLTVEIAAKLCVAARPGSVAVQLRDPKLCSKERLALGRELRAVTRRAGQSLVVNDRLDLAVLVEADGIHLGERSVPLAVLQTHAQGHACTRWISRAWHAPQQAPEAGAQAYLLSPVLEARKGVPPLGLATLREAVLRVPGAAVYALGGITAASAAACVDAGAAGVAAIGAAYREPQALLESLGMSRG